MGHCTSCVAKCNPLLGSVLTERRCNLGSFLKMVLWNTRQTRSPILSLQFFLSLIQVLDSVGFKKQLPFAQRGLGLQFISLIHLGFGESERVAFVQGPLFQAPNCSPGPKCLELSVFDLFRPNRLLGPCDSLDPLSGRRGRGEGEAREAQSLTLRRRRQKKCYMTFTIHVWRRFYDTRLLGPMSRSGGHGFL